MRFRMFHDALTFGSTLYFDATDGGTGGGGAPADGGTGGGQSPAAGTQGAPGAAGGEAPKPAGTTGAPQTFTYSDDRSKWIPPHRFNEVNTQAQRAKQLEQELETERQRVRALTGVEPKDPNAAKTQQVTDALLALPGVGPRLKKLLDLPDDKFDQLLSAPEHVEKSTAAEMREWQRHGNKSVDYIATAVADAMKVDEIDAEGREELRVSFRSWLQRRAQKEMQDTGSSPTVTRYEAGDEKLLDEFVTAHTKRWVEPGRRTGTALTVNRNRPVPDSRGRNAPTSVERPASFKSLDERLDYAARVAKEAGAFRS